MTKNAARGLAGHSVYSCLMIATAALAGLIAGYCLGSTPAFHRASQRLIVRAHLRPAYISDYAVLNSSMWSRMPYGQDCKGPGLQHLCELPVIWRDCSRGVYLDVGTNVGVQLRKLYNPEQFPDAAVLPIFQKVFGADRTAVCAIGIEANPQHTDYLETLNSFFRVKGYQAVVLTKVAASVRSGVATFYQDIESPVEWGASLTQGSWQKNPKGRKARVTVPLLDLPSFLSDIVRPMVMQDAFRTGKKPNIVMKLDVEGEEYAIVPALITNGALCDMDVVFMEQHPEYMKSAAAATMNSNVTEMLLAFEELRQTNLRCHVNVTNLDDESYMHGKDIPFPL